jgi:SAM-dependent methyltransferase
MTACPACGGRELADTVRRERLPTLQNYLYSTPDEAMTASVGRLTLAACLSCGFAWNRDFDPEALVYGAGYDNAVPSEVMEAYYREIAAHLAAAYPLESGLVVDIGCGNGHFLETLCAAVPGSRGLGIDPALERDRTALAGRVRLVQANFAADLIDGRPALVVCRHVLEHIDGVDGFLAEIAGALQSFGAVPCFFEVPDLEWIVDNKAFWDFCYEHCNYFTQASLRRALRRAGFEPTATATAFGGQYLWGEAVVAATPDAVEPNDLAGRLVAYASTEEAAMATSHETLEERKAAGDAIAVWGMATKGVLFSLLVDPEASLIDHCIDINVGKQGRFVPLSGRLIEAPEVLRALPASLVVVVMNDKYREEIVEMCRRLGVQPTMLTAHLTGEATLNSGASAS